MTRWAWTFGDRVRKARLVSGLTQAQLVARTGISSSAVASWERGRTQPNRHQKIGYAAAISAATGAPIAWLLEEEA